MNKLKKRILIVIVAVILNVAGRYLAFSLEWPMYFNLCGTILASYLEGPVVGSISAILGCAFSLTFSINDWYFLIADIFVAVAAGLIAKKNRYFERFALIYSSTAFFAVVRTPLLLMINLSTNGGKSGLYIVDAIFGYLESISSPEWLSCILAALFISFSDALAAMLLNYFCLKLTRSFGKKKRASELKKELMKKVSLGLVLVLTFTGISAYSSAFADNSISFIEKLYNSDKLIFHGSIEYLSNPEDWHYLLDLLYSIDWCPYIKETFNGFGNAIEYLGRYTHRIAITNTRVQSVTADKVSFLARNYKTGTSHVTTIDNTEFIRRLLMHVLPKGFQKIRYYGFLNNRFRYRNLELIFRLQGFQRFRSMYTGMSTEEILLAAWGFKTNVCRNCGCTDCMRITGRKYPRRC